MHRTFRWGLIGIGALGAALVAAEWYGESQYRADRGLPCTVDRQVRLKDGRMLGYRESGIATGRPVLYFHGALGSALEWPLDPQSAARAGLRLIGVDRPGYGGSDAAPGRRLTDWPEDVRQLADGLGIGRFRIIAWSAGTGYALACGVAMPERIERMDLVGAAVPESYPDGRELRNRDFVFFAALAQRAPGMAYAGLRTIIARRAAEPDWFEWRLTRALSAVDRQVCAEPRIYRAMQRSHASGECRLGSGVIADLVNLGGEWGFRASAVKVPVVMWQGGQDALTPGVRNLQLTRELPQVRRHEFPEEGHFLLYRHEMELLEAREP
jgi:pimeloyl-ACP methyl ester carboxylesterase